MAELVWVLAEKGTERYGEIIDGALMEDGATGTSFDEKGVVVLEGAEFFVQRVARDKLKEWK
eukprot:6828523-Lingulodinium_polyedra.AAC.1